jgi:hypothetical protein
MGGNKQFLAPQQQCVFLEYYPPIPTCAELAGRFLNGLFWSAQTERKRERVCVCVNVFYFLEMMFSDTETIFWSFIAFSSTLD